MDPSLYKSFQTARSYTYTYYSSVSPTSHQKQTLLFLHGFPEYADSWAAQVQSFNALGYACIVPDLLGYGSTSKPTDTEAYNSEGLSQDIADILTNENVDRAIIIGHDWGAYLAGRFANWQPARTLGLVVTSVAYRAAAKLDLDASNAALKKSFGFEPFGYWSWIASPEAPAVIEAHLESFYSLLFAENPEIWKTDFTPPGALPSWLSADKTAPTAPFMSPAAKSTLITRWAGDGFTAMLGWYRAMTENTHWAHESKLLSDAFKLQMPVLFVGGKRDAVAPSVLGDLATKPLCSDYEGVVLDCGHWVLREKGEEWGDVVRAWVGRKF